jgi:ribonucleoside-diphosphate reductase alpha chain
VRFLDNVIDVNQYPLQQIEETTKATRKIGLGVMGFADLLYKLGVPYNSNEGVHWAEDLMKFVDETAKDESVKLAKTRGVFPLFTKSIFKASKTRLRNATVTTIAPTGTISMIAGASSGVEPIFAISFIRNVMDGVQMFEVNPVFEETAKARGFYSEALMEKIARAGTLHGLHEIPEDVKKVFVTAHDVSPIWHIRIQAAFQKYTDNAVSKTVNFENSATRADVRKVYELAYETNCKGVTIYRDGSRDAQVLNIGKVNAPSGEQIAGAGQSADASEGGGSPIKPRPRPDVTTGFTEKIRIGCGNIYLTVNYDENGICEVFTNTGRGGGCPSQSEATARLVSIALRSGLDAQAIIEQLKGIRCPSTIKRQDLNVTSCPDAIAKVIQKVYHFKTNGEIPSATDVAAAVDAKPAGAKYCPECGSVVEHEGGCVICRNCGYSKCG